jgi:hypothetical protein
MTEATPEITPDAEGQSEPTAAETGPAAEPEPDAELDTAPELPDLPVEPARVQHPALDGDVQGEIEHRTPETTAEGMFTKTFSVGAIGIADDHPWHVANAGGVIQEAVQRGLHPKGDVVLIATEEHDDGRRSQYTDLTYQVPVVPAIVDHDPGSTITQHQIAEAVAARHEAEQSPAVVGEPGPELPSLPAGDTVAAAPGED